MRHLLLVLTLCAGPCLAAAPGCPEHFAGGKPPDVPARLGRGARELCFRAFAVLHSPVSRTALYSAEHLTAERIRAARQTPRDSEFRAEPSLPREERGELSDYARSGFDRGHLAPSGDMPDPEAQQESFSLANIVPQAPALNRGLWEGIESAVRTLAVREGELYVVTGPVFAGDNLEAVGDVLVPTSLWKAVLDPRRGMAAAYIVPNRDDADWRAVSMAELRGITGLQVFPGRSLRRLRLPDPTPTRPGNRHSGRSGDSR